MKERALQYKDVAQKRISSITEIIKAIASVPGVLVLFFILFIKRAMG